MSSRAVSALALIGAAAGVLGAASAAAMLAWPADAPPEVVHYPFSETAFFIAQSWFFVHHLGLMAGVVAFAIGGGPGTGRAGRIGAWLAVGGTAVLSLAELNTMRYANWRFDDANAGFMGLTYGVACTLVGVGMVLAGIGALRSGAWSGWRRWTPLVLGAAEFLMLTPGLFLGFVAARITIGLWMLMYAALSWSAWVELGLARMRNTRPALTS